MSDLVLDIIKSFLYERQETENGRLDGTFYVCRGLLNISKDTKISKSIFPTYFIMERHKDKFRDVYYKVYINKDSEGSINLISPNKDNCECHYFTKPIGAIHLLTTILSQSRFRQFTFIIEGSCIGNYVITFEDDNNIMFDPRVHVFLQNILGHYEYTDLVRHQYYNKVV